MKYLSVVLNWFSELFNGEKKDEVKSPVVVVPPADPIPEIPTTEEIENFPNVEIEDFKFVDSSHHHPEFDVKKYASQFKKGRAFLSNKCTQGTTFIDKTHAKRKKLCEENGVEYEGYHFYECKQDPIKQAQFYVKTHGEFTTNPQVDYETYKTKTSEQTEAMLIANKEKLWLFILEVKRLTGMWCILYVNYSAAKRMKFDSKFAVCPAWFARYNSFLGDIPAPWTKETTFAWQYTEKEKFPGFVGGNDVNIYYGKVNVLRFK